MKLRTIAWTTKMTSVLLLIATGVYGESRRLRLPAGFDVFQSPGVSTVDLPPFPEGFFGVDPAPGAPSDRSREGVRVRLRGHPSFSATPSTLSVPETSYWKHGNLTAHCFWRLAASSTGSTVIERTEDVVLAHVGDKATTRTKIAALSLRSIEPIAVTYGQGSSTQYFDVVVDLDRERQQRNGTMTLTRTGAKSGTFSGTLPVAFRLTFINTDPNGPQAISTFKAEIDMEGKDAPFIIETVRSHVPPSQDRKGK